MWFTCRVGDKVVAGLLFRGMRPRTPKAEASASHSEVIGPRSLPSPAMPPLLSLLPLLLLSPLSAFLIPAPTFSPNAKREAPLFGPLFGWGPDPIWAPEVTPKVTPLADGCVR